MSFAMPVRRPPLPHRPPVQRRRMAVRRRRLSDKIRDAFHTACDEGLIEIAALLLNQLDAIIRRPPTLPAGVDRRRPENVVALRERLANLVLWRIEAAKTNPPPGR